MSTADKIMRNENRIQRVMIWKQRALVTNGDIIDAAFACADVGEFSEFMELYREWTPENADKNMRFGLSYWGNTEQEERLLSYGVLCEVKDE